MEAVLSIKLLQTCIKNVNISSLPLPSQKVSIFVAFFSMLDFELSHDFSFYCLLEGHPHQIIFWDFTYLKKLQKLVWERVSVSLALETSQPNCGALSRSKNLTILITFQRMRNTAQKHSPQWITWSHMVGLYVFLC